MKKKYIFIGMLFIFFLLITIVILKDLPGQSAQESKKYTVDFYNENGVVIKQEEVLYGKNATAPKLNYDSSKYVFIGWDKTFSNVTENISIHPNLVDITSEKNVITSSYVYSSGEDKIRISLQITGEVNFCCMELEIEYDEKYLKFLGATNVDGDSMINNYNGKLHYVFASGSNIKGSVDLMTLEFEVLKANNQNKQLLDIFVSDIASFGSDGDFIDENYVVYTGDVNLN